MRESGRSSLSQPRYTAHAVAAGAVSERSPAKKPIRKAKSRAISGPLFLRRFRFSTHQVGVRYAFAVSLRYSKTETQRPVSRPDRTPTLTLLTIRSARRMLDLNPKHFRKILRDSVHRIGLVLGHVNYVFALCELICRRARNECRNMTNKFSQSFCASRVVKKATKSCPTAGCRDPLRTAA